MINIQEEEMLESFFKYKTTTFYTAIPCRIITIHSSLSDQRVDVQPLVLKKLDDGTTKEHPVILNVPVMFPASKTASLTFPLDIGDIVLCVFSQRALDGFKNSKDSSLHNPQDYRRFDIRDAIAIPGLFSFSNAINNPTKHKWTHSTRDLVIVNNIGKSTECEIRLKENGNIEMRTDQDFYGQFNDGVIECNNMTINCAGNFTVDAQGTVSVTSGADTTIDAGTSLDLSAATTADITAPTINLNGAVNMSGLTSMLANAVVTGTLLNNGINVGGNHKHAEFDGGNGGYTGDPV